MRHNAPTRALLEHEAILRAQLTSYRQLSVVTGYSEQYIANYVGRLACQKRRKVNLSKLKPGRRYTDDEIDQFAADLLRK